jgi:hypothetical protein
MKCLSFARGFESWGVLVRMIVRILDKIGHFLCVMALLIVGFGISFSVALGDLQPDFRTPWDAVLWLVNAGMYGYGESESTFYTGYALVDFVTIVLFQLLMLMVALIMLNLLIAIMNSAYEQVQAMAQLEVLHEKSLIILGIERLWLPVLRKLGLHRDRAAHARGGRPGGARACHEGESEDFPRWLHLLVPTALLHPDEYV